MAIKTRWGVLGCGRIARKFSSDLKLVEDAELIAAGSRSREAAEKFSNEFPVKYLHDSYEALVKNPEVDVIYIASPHGLHHEHVMLCLNNNKHVLCEKAFALNARQAKEMIDKAKKEKLFLMEALWTKFMPHYKKVLEFVQQGQLGTIKNVLVNFGFAPIPPVPARLFDPSLGGGSVLDIGIYNIFITISVLGKPDEISATMTPASTGVDEQCSIVFKYKNGAVAQLFSSLSTNLATEADISGDKARIRLTSRFYEPSTTIEFYPGRPETKQVIPYDKEPGWGYQYEIRHVQECLRKGLTESPVMSHGDTMMLMEIMDEVRRVAEIRYSVD